MYIGLMLFIMPAMLLGLVAQAWIRSSYAAADRVDAGISGAAAAKEILIANGIHNVAIGQTPGRLSDHYDPQHKVLRLSEGVYHGRSLAAVGVAAHEAGHALQDAGRYWPLVVRNAAVPAASYGSNSSYLLMFLGVAMGADFLLVLGIVLFSAVVFLQVVNLPVEYNASRRAKVQLADLGIVAPQQMAYVRKVLHAAALTYVAVTLQAILTLLWYIVQLLGRRRAGHR